VITTGNKILISLLSACFLFAAGLDAYYQSVSYMAMPIVLLGILLLIQKPEFLFYCLAISIPWSVEYHLDGNISTDFPDEPIMLLASAATLIWFTYQRKKISYRNLHPLLIVTALQFLWMVISTVNSTDLLLSIKYSLAKTWYLLAFVGLPLILFREEKILKRSAVLLVASMLIAMFVAIARHAEYNFSFEKVNDALQPFFRNHVNYSALLVFTVPIQIAIKTFVICLLIITIAALYFSYSRGSWLALVAGTLSYWLLRKRMLLLSFVVFILVTISSVFWLKSNGRYLNYSNDYRTTIYHADFKQHLIATYKLKDLSNAERIYRWVAGVNMIPDNWKTGTGPTTFYSQYKTYTVPAFKTYVSDNKEQSTVHNYFLLVLIEQGVMGVVLFILLVGSIFWYAQKVYHQAKENFWKVVASTVASIIVMECAVNFLSDMIETDKAGSVFYLCLATLIVADLKTRSRRGSDLSANV
jgi:O-antigen ligase